MMSVTELIRRLSFIDQQRKKVIKNTPNAAETLIVLDSAEAAGRKLLWELADMAAARYLNMDGLISIESIAAPENGNIPVTLFFKETEDSKEQERVYAIPIEFFEVPE